MKECFNYSGTHGCQDIYVQVVFENWKYIKRDSVPILKYFGIKYVCMIIKIPNQMNP